MKQGRTLLPTVIFLAALLAAGVVNALGRYITKLFMTDHATPLWLPCLSTVTFCLNLAIYIVLLLFWAQSVRRRLLPSRERSCLVAAAFCAIAMLVLRSIKYRLIDDNSYELLRYVWYLYYVPMILLPTLFLMTCIRIEGRKRMRFDERLLLVPAGVLMLLFLTNDLHFLAFRPAEGHDMNGMYFTYTTNVLLYVYYAYYVICIGLGLFLVTAVNRRRHDWRRIALPFVFLAVMMGFYMLDRLMIVLELPSMYLVPEIVAFGMIGVFESCVRNRLIPFNDNYEGFFRGMRFPSIITEPDLTPVYRSAEAVEADEAQLWASLEAPVYLDPDTKLTGKALTSGYSFYTEDESGLHRMNERLRDANELIESELELIQAENDLRRRQAAVDSRNLIYSRIAEKMLPYHRRALELLSDMKPDSPEFRAQAARLNVLNAYIKRATNLLLTNEGEPTIACRELKLALEESARYLAYCGIEAGVNALGDGELVRGDAIDLYTCFYELTELLIERATMLHIVYEDGVLRLIADCADPGALTELTLPVEVRQSDGLCFFLTSVPKGGAS